jgi:hypothetical protein
LRGPLNPYANKDIKIKVKISKDNPNYMIGKVTKKGKVLFEDSIYIDSCSGLGGYNCADYDETGEFLRKKCESFVKGYKAMKNLLD